MTQGARTQKFKICLVSISLGKGGAERSVAMLSRMLSAKGHDVHIVILTNVVGYPFSGTLLNLGLLKKESDAPLRRISRFKKFRTYLKEQQFDVIIDHRAKNRYFREVFYDQFVYKGFERIYVVHSSKIDNYLSAKPSNMVEIYNKNKVSVAVSEYIRKEILHTNGIKNTATIHNAFDPAWKDNLNELPSELNQKNYILSYGRFNDSIKDFSFLIQAFNHSEVWKKDIYLVILGEGKDEQMLKDLATSMPCGDLIKFLPFTNNPFSIIANAKFVTLTSKYEGFPMVLVESLSLGTPVVSLDIVSGPSEIIIDRENGLLVSKREVPLFAEAMQKFFKDQALYITCKKNAEASVQQFSMERISEQWNQLIQNELH